MKRHGLFLVCVIGLLLAPVAIAQEAGPAAAELLPAFEMSDVARIAVVGLPEQEKLTSRLLNELASASRPEVVVPPLQWDPLRGVLAEARAKDAQAVLMVAPCVTSSIVRSRITTAPNSAMPGSMMTWTIPGHEKFTACLQAVLVETNRGDLLWQGFAKGSGARAVREIVEALPLK